MNNRIPKSTIIIAWVVVFGAMAPLLDSTMINIAINKLVNNFNSSVTTVQWTITCYVLATGIAVPFSSWLLNKFDGKNVFMFSEVLFGIGSALAAISPNIQFLIGARLIQGFAGGLIMPLLTTLLVQTAGAAVMGQMMATVGLPMILGPLLGPVIGGVIIKFLSWHWIFWINVPVTLISIGLIIWKMPNYPAQNKKAKLDFIGILLLIGSSSSIIYGMVKAAHKANFTNKTTLIFLATGVSLLLLYIVWGAIRGKKAVIPLNLFKHSSFNGSIIGLFIAGTVLNGAMLLLPLFFQNVRHTSVMMAALALIPQGVGMLISRPLTGRLTDSIGAKYVVFVSVLITFVGTIPFYWINANTAYWIIAIVLLVRGIGTGGILTPLMADSYTGMKTNQISSATIGSRILQNIGSAFGSALVTTVVTAFSTAHVKSFEHQLKVGKIKPAPDQLAAFAHHHLVNIQTNSFQHGFLIISLAALLITLPTLLLSNKMNSKNISE
ncbi:MDR family MFS transporter [Lentilactobacillus hilgardii]|uniref:MDR family MFS transporter n=1 Tax=Lentilactobacillus hilgardii TaxID=1588 RepID=UPI0021A3649F|nr:MDR family MFS transporter [Lentilactobacillus hilgardii]MCT3400597.1 DHA2 family efflux MFS transporter permease subunit [Lentilactobacillus hilgardii]